MMLLIIASAIYSGWHNPPLSYAVKNRPILLSAEPASGDLSRVDSLQILTDSFDKLVKKIRDGKIEKEKAKTEVAKLLGRIKIRYSAVQNAKQPALKIFPVKGYNAKAIGGKNGEGYKPRGYNFYDGNNHTGHPAHDIFIYDKDQNCLDDQTGKPVNIVTMSNGIVVGTEVNWQPESKLRGGIYVIVYDPAEDLLYYYAHNNKLLVKTGTIVKAGDKLAELGRSGLNAFKQRSSTHLHLMALKVKPSGILEPLDLYPVLKLFK